MLTQTQQAEAWGHSCYHGTFFTIALYGSGHATIRPEIADAASALSACLKVWSYETEAADTGGFCCRAKTGDPNSTSNHGRGIAIDVNWKCLAGDTKVITPDGPVAIEELAGTIARILTRDPFKGGQSKWIDAPIVAFGEQETKAVTISRRGISRTIRATAEHRWFIHRKAARHQAAPKRSIIEVTTAELQPGDSIVGCLPPPYAHRTIPSSVGIAAGNVYGDGTRDRNRGSWVDLYGESMELIRFYAEPNVHSIASAAGQPGLRVSNLPGSWKARPSLDESASYLLGWLAGYFAADGTVGKNGHAAITSANLDDLEFFSAVATRVGIACAPPQSVKREGISGEMSLKHTMALIASTVPAAFFVRLKHHERFSAAGRQPNGRYDFTVDEIGPGLVEPVYCAVQTGTGAFTLDGFILTGNSNPYGAHLVTNMPLAMIQAICGIRTNSGAQVWNWGGNWHGNKDAMHFEIVCTPGDLLSGINQRTIPFAGSAPAAQSGPIDYAALRRGIAQNLLDQHFGDIGTPLPEPGVVPNRIYVAMIQQALNLIVPNTLLPVSGTWTGDTGIALFKFQVALNELVPNGITDASPGEFTAETKWWMEVRLKDIAAGKP